MTAQVFPLASSLRKPEPASPLQRLRQALFVLYGEQPGFEAWYADLLARIHQLAAQRPESLKALDQQRRARPAWFCSNQMLAYSAYVDRFGATLPGVQSRIPYLKELGVNLLHLLPFLRARAGDSDGGFAVARYDEVEPRLGTWADLQALSAALHQQGMSLCADFVLNHVADDHPWALAARAGDAAYQDFFHCVDSATQRDQWEATLGQVFPQTAPGNFTWVEALQTWVWTTFYPYQWDLNYGNPQVFSEVALALLRLANVGVDVFRLDSIAYLWKQPGTRCMNLPQVHVIVQALRAITDTAAPGVLLLAEAIVPTQEIPPYFGSGAARGLECHLAYHSSLMAGAWASLAEGHAELVRAVLTRTPRLPQPGSWISYVRCHDDIGWNVLRPECETLGDTQGQRLRAVSRFFAGETPGSYARGLAFQASDAQAVHGSNGMSASLLGLQADQGEAERAQALQRLSLLMGLAFTVGGLPLIYMGDELGLANAPWQAGSPGSDSRQLHRPTLDPVALLQRQHSGSLAQQVFERLRRLIQARQSLPELAADQALHVLDLGAPAVLAFQRGHSFVFLGNFSDQEQPLQLSALRRSLNASAWWDLLAQQALADTMRLAPWESRWLRACD